MLNDIKTDENKLVFYSNNKDHPFNADVCNILKELSDNLFDLESTLLQKNSSVLLKINP